MSIAWKRQNVASYGDGSYYGEDYYGLSISCDGQTIAVCGYYYGILGSRDGGTTWTLISPPYVNGYSDDFLWVTAKNDGFILGTTFYGIVYLWDWDSMTLTDITPSVGTKDMDWFEWADASVDGQHIYLQWSGAIWPGYTDRCICISHDYGTTWSYKLNGKYITSISVNSSGDMALVVTWEELLQQPGRYGAHIYMSWDSGVTWNETWFEPDWDSEDNGGDAHWTGMDDTGQHIVVYFDYPKTCLVSSDYGNTWTRKQMMAPHSHSYDLNRSSYTGAGDISCDGSRLIFCHFNQGTWISSDFGDTWTEVYPGDTSDTIGGWDGIQFWGSSTTKIAVCNYQGWWDGEGFSNPLWVSTDFGTTWTSIYPYAGLVLKDDWCVASDTTGDILVAAARKAYISSNGGSSWNELTTQSSIYPEYTFSAIAISDDGSYIAIWDDWEYYLHLSSDGGATWSKISSLPQSSSPESIAMSGNGQYILLQFTSGAYSMCYLSYDYGQTYFISLTIENNDVYGIAINYSGSIMIITTRSQVLVSRDYGLSWQDITDMINTQTGTSSAEYIYHLTCDTSGQYIYGWNAEGYCHYSTYWGFTWKKTPEILPPVDNGRAIVCNTSTGGRVFVLSDNTPDTTVGYSIDFGSTWSVDSGVNIDYPSMEPWWSSLDTNGTGTKLLVGEPDGYVYIGTMGGNIKSISSAILESIKDVANVLISNLGKISGVTK